MRRLLAVLLVPALLAGCGESEPPRVVQRPSEVLKLAGDRTTAAGTARMEMRVSGGGVELTGSGVTALQEIKGVMTTSTTVAGQTFDSEMRMLGDVLWMTAPPGVGSGKPWLKIDISEMLKRQDVDIDALTELQRQNDPTQSLAFLQGASDDIAAQGTEDLRGTRTTRYKGTLDLEKARDAAKSDAQRTMLDSAIRKLKTSTLPIEAWIDDEGRMRKIVQTMDLGLISDGQASGTMRLTFELYDFGVAVEVTPPPADQVGDGSALFPKR